MTRSFRLCGILAGFSGIGGLAQAGDLDMALTDEIADVIILMENQGVEPVPTVSQWGAMVMSLMLLTAGTVLFGRLRRAVRPAAGLRG